MDSSDEHAFNVIERGITYKSLSCLLPLVAMYTLFEIYCYVINGLAIFWNTILLILSAHNSIEAIQELRYFLSNISVSGILLSVCVLLLQPQMITRGGMAIRVPLGPAGYFGDYYCKLLASMAITFYMYGMLSFPLFFVYRTMILINSNTWGQYFSKKNLLATFFIMFIFACVQGSFFYYSNIPYNDLFDRLNKTTNVTRILEKPKHLAAPTTYHIGITTPPLFVNVSGGAYNEDSAKLTLALFGDDYVRNPLILYFQGMCAVSHGIAYLIILISAHFMLKTLKEKQGALSRDTVLANEVLVHAVFAEAFLPLLVAAPVAANAALCFIYENSLQWQEFLLGYCISMVPLLSPLTSIAFIKPYRETMKGVLTLGFLRKQEANANDKADEE